MLDVRREAIRSITPVGSHVDDRGLSNAKLTGSSIHALDYLTLTKLMRGERGVSKR